jgi:superfamily II DNA or RNA helicase
MFSSEHGANGLSTTQRIGRALRYVESNPSKISHVYDFVRANTEEGQNDFERRRWLQDLSMLRPDNWERV